MKKTLLSAAAMIALTLAPAALANSYTWNLTGSSSQLLGATDTVVSTTGNISMVFSGFLTNSTDVAGTSKGWFAPTAKATDLYAKAGSGDETGLGIAADPSGDHEIIANSFIQINLAGLLAQKQINYLQLMIGSVQSGEEFTIWGSNQAGQPGTLLMTGTSSLDDVAFNVPSYGSYQYISVSAMCGNVLLDTVTAGGTTTTTNNSSTPEPGTLALGMIACAGLFSKKLLSKRLGRRG